jgi:hypothetical protein
MHRQCWFRGALYRFFARHVDMYLPEAMSCQSTSASALLSCLNARGGCILASSTVSGEIQSMFGFTLKRPLNVEALGNR